MNVDISNLWMALLGVGQESVGMMEESLVLSNIIVESVLVAS